MRRWAVLLVVAAAAAALALAGSAQANVLVNAVPKKTCFEGAYSFEVGVWFKPGVDKRRRFWIAIYDRKHRLVFFRKGLAPRKSWRCWKISPPRPGRYTVYYRVPGGTQRYVTTVRSCRG